MTPPSNANAPGEPSTCGDDGCTTVLVADDELTSGLCMKHLWGDVPPPLGNHTCGYGPDGMCEVCKSLPENQADA